MRRRTLAAAALAGLAFACRLGTDALPPGSASAAPHLVVTPESLAFHGRAGDTILPDQYLSLSYDADVSGRWAAFEDGSWFFLATGGDTLPFFLPVGPRPGGLAAGSYRADIWIVAARDTLHVPVTLQLDTAASLAHAPVQFSGLLVNDRMFARTLSGGGLTAFSLTFSRQ